MTGLPANLIRLLRKQLGPDAIIEELGARRSYGYDNSRRRGTPDLVVLPIDHQQVRSIVTLCYEQGLPLISRGRGTGTTGATVPDQGGIVLSTERMTTRLDIDADNRLAIVSPGHTNEALQQAAAKQGFFWPPDPTSAAFCSIGGNLAYNSAGPRAIKYGTPRENTLGLTAVTGRGETLHTGSRTTKGVVGYDLTRLLVGSEGTLAVFTEAILKLSPLPQRIQTLQVLYRDIASAAAAVSRIMRQPVTPYTLEFIDGNAINMIREYAGIALPQSGAMLMIEVDGSDASLASDVDAVVAAAEGDGFVACNRARDDAERQALWKVRKALSPALRNIAPKKINEDVVVPVSRMPTLIEGLNILSERYRVPIVNFGHAGNGNIHVNLLVNPDDADEMRRAHACLDEVFSLVLELKGTLSGEHGVGLEKRDFVKRELDAVSLRIMHELKTVFDPKGIMNPGKMLPPL